MNKLQALWKAIVDILDPAGDWIALLPIRLLMAYEFFKAGLTKFNGNNWFGRFQEDFLFPSFLGIQPDHPLDRRDLGRPLAG
jgi:uncharacterized membrane protein YphA (DoxX/SURF4 family)